MSVELFYLAFTVELFYLAFTAATVALPPDHILVGADQEDSCFRGQGDRT